MIGSLVWFERKNAKKYENFSCMFGNVCIFAAWFCEVEIRMNY